jgi:hypothetical protein
MPHIMRVAIVTHIGMFCFFLILCSFGNHNIRNAIEVIPF